ncbi:dTDP-4-dehydrorhamnose 3,5-epimerase [Pararhizobium capsulatum]
MEVRPLGLDGIVEITPLRLSDERGYFSEVWNAKRFSDHGFDLEFVQDNQSYSAEKGVLRGLHYQLPPFAQDKLVRVVHGSIFDVAVDIRRGSTSFGHWTALRISSSKGNQILVPKGFAHGFVTLEPNTEVVYKVTNPYSHEHDRSIRFDDPHIGISWPFSTSFMRLSEKDLRAPRLEDADVFEILQEIHL